MLPEKTRKTSPFTHCSLGTAHGQPPLLSSECKPCSTPEWLSDGNWCRFPSCCFPETFSLRRTFLSVLLVCFGGSQVRDIKGRPWGETGMLQSELPVSRFLHTPSISEISYGLRPLMPEKILVASLYLAVLRWLLLFLWHKDPTGIYL